MGGNTVTGTDVLPQVLGRTSKLNSIAGELRKLGLLGSGETSRLFGFPKPCCEVAFLKLGFRAASDFLGNTAKGADVLQQVLGRTSKLNSIAGELCKLGLLGGRETSRLFGSPKLLCEAAFMNLGC